MLWRSVHLAAPFHPREATPHNYYALLKTVARMTDVVCALDHESGKPPMAEFSFFRQLREDGGIRTGIELNGEYCWESLHEGTGDDPALVWYVDVRGRGDRVPCDEGAIVGWLMDQSQPVRDALYQLAARLAAGYDFSIWPVRWPIASSIPDVSLEVVVSTIRRMDALNVAGVLRELADSWMSVLESLEPVTPVIH